jgi:hypothetical protein
MHNLATCGHMLPKIVDHPLVALYIELDTGMLIEQSSLIDLGLFVYTLLQKIFRFDL